MLKFVAGKRFSMSLVSVASVVFYLVIVFTSQVFSEYPEIYFGDFHSHTSFSDGSKTPDYAFAHAKNSGRADFLAITDHSWHDSSVLAPLWDSVGNSAKKYTDSKFLAIRGFEFTQSFGHMVILNTDWFARKGSITEFYELLVKDTNCIAQWNHPGDFYGGERNFENFAHYSAELDKIINMIEIMNFKRNKKYEDSYVMALDKGWHVGPAANSDMHQAKWITGYSWRTAVLADNLSLKGLFSAIKKRRTYATEDRNIRLYYTINDSLMGSIINNPVEIRLKVDISDPDKQDPKDKIALVEVVGKNGKCIKSQKFDSHIVNWETLLNVNRESGTYFYVRVTNAESKIVISAPIWIDYHNSMEKSSVLLPFKLRAVNKTKTHNVCIYDISGRIVGSVDLQKRTALPHLRSGVYITNSGLLLHRIRN